ncbi:MAG: putative methylase [Clostridia bacterium]|nr:putative methylase [Clostridia bacterium]
MINININEIGDVMILDEFLDIYNSSKSYEVCHTSVKASEILNMLKNNHTVIIKGDYQKAEYLMYYLHRFENDLVNYEETKRDDLGGVSVNRTALIRNKLYRLTFIVYNNKFPLLENVPVENDLQKWISEDMQDYRYLLPARRYYRILTDIKRVENGIYIDFIKTKLYILPFVYVPFDKSVPEMFLSYRHLIKDKTVIDIGTGTGIIPIIAAQMGAKCVAASDINTNAVECTYKNVVNAGFEKIVTKVFYSDLFDNVSGKFDVIIFNAPWIKGNPKNIYEIAIYDPQFAVVNRFFRQVQSYLTDNGIILLQYSDISQKNGDGSIENLQSVLKENNFYIADNSSILRRNRLLGMIERVFIFVIKFGGNENDN